MATGMRVDDLLFEEDRVAGVRTGPEEFGAADLIIGKF